MDPIPPELSRFGAQLRYYPSCIPLSRRLRTFLHFHLSVLFAYSFDGDSGCSAMSSSESCKVLVGPDPRGNYLVARNLSHMGRTSHPTDSQAHIRPYQNSAPQLRAFAQIYGMSKVQVVDRSHLMYCTRARG